MTQSIGGPDQLRFVGHSSSMKALAFPGSADMDPPVTLTFPPAVELVDDVSPALWAEGRMTQHPFAAVGALVPDVFESYVRILHPATELIEGDHSRPVSWKEVAARTGRIAHPLMQFERIAELGDDPNAQPSWGHRPDAGDLPWEVSEPLVGRLREFTSTPQLCWFCLWDGFGGLDLITDFSRLPRVKAPGREYLLLRGPLDAMVVGIGNPQLDWHEPPQLWWPEDRTWCVATEIDLDSTYVGGSSELAAALLSAEDLEVVPANIDDPVHVGADIINAG